MDKRPAASAPEQARAYTPGRESMEDEKFVLAGIRPQQDPAPVTKTKWREGKPLISMGLLFLILAGCFGCELFIPKDPAYMDLGSCSVPPGSEFWFGTDAMGRDIFSMIWHGGRISLVIGFVSAGVSVLAAVLAGSASGLAPRRLDGLLMRFTEIFMSIPGLLPVILLQAAFGRQGVFGISFVIGITSWPAMAKVVRTEVRQMRNSEYITAARCMGGGFFHILVRHLAPNFISSIMFMAVMNIRSAIAAESTLSFMGIGLPLDVISWGSMLSLSERALLGGAWWVILVPGVFLILTLSCVTNIGNYLRKGANRGAE